METTFGLEVEFFIPDSDLRNTYLSRGGNFLKLIMGTDSSSELTQEYRSPIFNNYMHMLGHFKIYREKAERIYGALFTSYEEIFCESCNVIHPIPMGAHLSIGNWTYTHILKALWVYVQIFLHLYKGVDTKYYKRFQFYPDFVRIHKERIEFRFLPNNPELVRKIVAYITQ